MSTTTDKDLERQVNGVAADLEYLVRIMQGNETDNQAMGQWFADRDFEVEDPETADWQDVANEYLAQDVLEIVEHGIRLPAGEWEFRSMCVVFMIGGPHIELDTSKGAVMGYWGGDRSRMGVTSDVVEYFESMVSE